MDSLKTFSTRMVSWPVVLTQPDVRLLPGATVTGTGSPVMGAVSIRL